MKIRKSISFLILNSSFIIFNFLHAQNYDLETLTAAMYSNNSDIRLSTEEYKRSVLDYNDAIASFFPKVDMQLSGTYMTKPIVGPIYLDADDIIDSFEWPSGISKPSNVGNDIKIYDGTDQTFFNLGFSVEQPIFTWGKLHNAAKLYKEVSQIQEIKMENTKSQLGTELETRLASLDYLKKIYEVLEEEKIYANEMVKFSEDAEKAGLLLHQDVIDARIKAKELDMAKQNVNEQISNQLLEIERLTGIDDLTIENINYTFSEDLSYIYNSDKETRNNFLNDSLSGNQSTIKMVTKAKNVSDIATKIAKNSLYWKPDIGLQISAGYGGFKFPFIQDDWQNKDDYSLTFSIGIKTTVWDGGKKLNDVARKKSNAESAQINADTARATIKKSLQEQFNTIDLCTIKIEYQDLKIETAESKIKQQELLVKSGYGSQTDLLSAKINKCNEQIEKIQQELQRTVAGLTVKFLIGETN